MERTDINAEELLKLVESDQNIHFVRDLLAVAACSSSTYYERIPAEKDGSKRIKEALLKNRSRTKMALRKMFIDPDSSPSEKIVLYKLLGNQDERDALNGKTKEEPSVSSSEQFEIIKNQYED